MTTQIAVKLPDDIVVSIDRLIANGIYPNRSAAIRAGLKMVTEQARTQTIDAAFAQGFKHNPETEEELAEAYRSGIEAIEDEPWERWW